MNAVNHTVSRRIVASAEFKNADVVLEDLEGCRQTMKQRKENRANKGKLHEYATLRGCGLDGRIPASSRGSVNWHTKEILKPPTTTFKDSAVRLVFIIDPIQNLDPTHDTSVALMEAAQALGHQVWVTQANLLASWQVRLGLF